MHLNSSLGLHNRCVISKSRIILKPKIQSFQSSIPSLSLVESVQREPLLAVPIDLFPGLWSLFTFLLRVESVSTKLFKMPKKKEREIFKDFFKSSIHPITSPVIRPVSALFFVQNLEREKSALERRVNFFSDPSYIFSAAVFYLRYGKL